LMQKFLSKILANWIQWHSKTTITTTKQNSRTEIPDFIPGTQEWFSRGWGQGGRNDPSIVCTCE
jgi:hypothetical protein